jgi:hypothetical protein
LERGLRENGSVSGAKSQEGPTPFKILRRQNGPFSPNPLDAAYFAAECVENARDTLGITCAFRLFSNKIRLAPRPIDN